MAIIGPQTLVYGVEDLTECRRFWLDFGLKERPSRADHGLVFECADGTSVVLYSNVSPELPPTPCMDSSTVRQVMWGVEEAGDLDRIAVALEGWPSLQREPGRVRALDPNGYSIAFVPAERRPLVTSLDTYNAARHVERRGRRAQIYTQAEPQFMSHVVFYTPQLEETKEFYTRRLGFCVTDSYPGRSIFLRAPGAAEHHNLFLLHSGDRLGFHHVAFEVRSIHEVFGGGLHLTDCGWQTFMGPGRHPVSSAYFWYFSNPSGGAAEYDWDSDVVNGHWEAREWPLLNTTFAEWLVPEGVKRFQGFGS